MIKKKYGYLLLMSIVIGSIATHSFASTPPSMPPAPPQLDDNGNPIIEKLSPKKVSKKISDKSKLSAADSHAVSDEDEHFSSSPFAPGSMSPAMAAITGDWVVQSKDGVVQLAPCEVGSPRLCGWLVGIDYKEAEPPKDHWGRSMCGLGFVLQLEQKSDKKWSGHILDPRGGGVYNANIKLTRDGKLKLRGFMGVELFGKTETWTRYHGPSVGLKQQCRLKMPIVSNEDSKEK